MKEINYDQFFKRPRDAWPPQKSVNIHCKFKQLKVIENVLRRENAYDEFQGSCFKHFLEVPEHLTFSAQLVHNLMLREISLVNANSDEMWFSIGGKKARFSKREFCLVTGLKFGKLSDVFLKEYKPLKDGIHMRYFQGDMDLKLTHILEHFQQGKFARPQDCLKMALVLIANNVLFGQDYRRKVTFWLLALVENVKDFNDFAWGHYVFKLTSYYLRLGLGRSNLYGFPWALQIWAMEAIPSMRAIFADRLLNNHPRFLKWSFKRKPKKFKDQLQSLEEKGEFIAKEELRPTKSELGESYWDGIDINLSQGPQFVPPTGLGDDEEGFVDLDNIGNVGGEPVEENDVQTVGEVGTATLPTTKKKRKSVLIINSKAARKKRLHIPSPLMDDSTSHSLSTYFPPKAASAQASPRPLGLDDIAMLRQAIDGIPQHIEHVVKQEIRALEDRILARIEVLFANNQPTSPQQDDVQNFNHNNVPDSLVIESDNNATSLDVVAAKHVPANEVQMVEAVASAEVALEVDAVKDVAAKEFVQSEEVIVSAEDMRGEEDAIEDLQVPAFEVPTIEDAEVLLQMKFALEGLYSWRLERRRISEIKFGTS